MKTKRLVSLVLALMLIFSTFVFSGTASASMDMKSEYGEKVTVQQANFDVTCSRSTALTNKYVASTGVDVYIYAKPDVASKKVCSVRLFDKVHCDGLYNIAKTTKGHTNFMYSVARTVFGVKADNSTYYLYCTYTKNGVSYFGWVPAGYVYII